MLSATEALALAANGEINFCEWKMKRNICWQIANAACQHHLLMLCNHYHLLLVARNIETGYMAFAAFCRNFVIMLHQRCPSSSNQRSSGRAAK